MKKKQTGIEWFKEFTPIENLEDELKDLVSNLELNDNKREMQYRLAVHELFLKLLIQERKMFENAYWRGYFDCDRWKKRKKGNPAESFYKELYGAKGYENGIFNPKLDYNES